MAQWPRASRSVIGNTLDQNGHGLPHLRVANAYISPQQAQARRGLQQLKYLARAGPGAFLRREQVRDGYVQGLSDALKPSGADAVGAFFVFLHLLERQAERIA